MEQMAFGNVNPGVQKMDERCYIISCRTTPSGRIVTAVEVEKKENTPTLASYLSYFAGCTHYTDTRNSRFLPTQM
jgi:hypothetical protein